MINEESNMKQSAHGNSKVHTQGHHRIIVRINTVIYKYECKREKPDDRALVTLKNPGEKASQAVCGDA